MSPDAISIIPNLGLKRQSAEAYKKGRGRKKEVAVCACMLVELIKLEKRDPGDRHFSRLNGFTDFSSVSRRFFSLKKLKCSLL